MSKLKGYKQTDEHKLKKAESLKRGNFFNCLICNESFWRRPSEIKKGNNKFCSKPCYFIWQKGREKDFSNRRSYKNENNPNWKGGITPINKKIRDSDDFKIWRKSVFKRDNWTCQRCNVKSRKNNYVYIHAHHIKPFAKFPQFRFEITNGLTLCKECHSLEPKGKEIWKVK